MEQGFEECNSSNLPKVDFNMVYEFMIEENANEAAGTSKEERSARPTYGDKAIGKVQLKRDGSTCVVNAKITPEHSIRKSAYNVTCTIDEEAKKIINAQCGDCPASQGGCKHRVAFIMWLHRRSEEPSPTEVTSYWKKSVLSEAGLQPLAIQCLSTRQVDEYNVPSTSQKHEFRAMVQEDCGPNVSLSCYSHGVLDDMEVLDIHKMVQGCSTYQDFIEKIQNKLSSVTIQKIEAMTRDQASSPAWHLAHYGRVTASKFHSVAQCHTEDGSLVNAILGEKIKSSKAMERGSRLENEIFNVLKKKYPNLKKCGLYLHKEYPLFGASPDGITEDMVFEIKCPSSSGTVTNYLKDGKINIKYQLQMQMQMALCNLKKGCFVVADPLIEKNKKITIVKVEFCPDLFQAYLTKAEAYYKTYIYPHLVN